MKGVYKITNKINGMIYIGSSNDIDYRWRKHKEMLVGNRHYSKHLQNSWNKYGEENFLFEILEETSEELLLLREQHYLDTLTPFDTLGYNTCRTAGSPLGNTHSLEIRKKISKAGMGRKWSDDTRKKIINKISGKKRTQEQLKKFSESQKLRWEKMSEEERQLKKQQVKEHFAKYPKKVSEETKEKIRQSLKGRKRPKEFCEKMSKIRKGKKLSEETKQKLRDIAKERKNNE